MKKYEQARFEPTSRQPQYNVCTTEPASQRATAAVENVISA